MCMRMWPFIRDQAEIAKKKDPESLGVLLCGRDGSPAENRTPVSALKGLRPNRWTTGPCRANWDASQVPVVFSTKYQHTAKYVISAIGV